MNQECPQVRRLQGNDWFADVPSRDTEWLQDFQVTFQVHQDISQVAKTHSPPYIVLTGYILQRRKQRTILACSGLLASVPWDSSQHDAHKTVVLVVQPEQQEDRRLPRRRARTIKGIDGSK